MTRSHSNLDDTIENVEGLTFRAWYIKADEECAAICGLTIDDLADGPSWSNWEAGISPKEYAIERLTEEDYPMDILEAFL